MEKKHFRHWEHFEVFYLHLGNAMNQIYHLWDILFKLKGIKGKARSNLENLLIKRKKKYLCRKIAKIDKEIIVLRNNITHYARGIHYPLPDGRYTVPLVTKSKHSWEMQSRCKMFRETSAKCTDDLENFEKTINNLHKALIEELDVFIDYSAIKVKY